MNLYVLFPMIEEALVWTSPSSRSTSPALLHSRYVSSGRYHGRHLVAYLVGLFYKIRCSRKFIMKKLRSCGSWIMGKGEPLSRQALIILGSRYLCSVRRSSLRYSPILRLRYPGQTTFQIPDLLIRGCSIRPREAVYGNLIGEDSHFYGFSDFV